MVQQSAVDHLIPFGLTRQEATVYECLIREGKLTGYEVAKLTGISRSNAYSALAALADKGAAYVLEESAKKYVAVPAEEFCGNRIRSLAEEKEWLAVHLQDRQSEEDGYITIEGYQNILNKMKNLLLEAKERVYLSCTANYLSYVERELQGLLDAGKKVVIITDSNVTLGRAQVYVNHPKGSQIGMIVDSRKVLTGKLETDGKGTCLYSGQKNFVEVFKTALANEIKLIGYTKGE